MDIGKLQFKLADRCYFELLCKCSLNITECTQWILETSVSCYPKMQWKLFHSAPKILARILITVCYLLYSTFQLWQFFCRIKQCSSLIFFRLLTESLFSIRCLRQHPHKWIKRSFGKYCRAVSIIVKKWKTICNVNTVQRGSEHDNYLWTRQLSLCQRNQYFSRLIVTEGIFGEMFALKNKFFNLKLA